MDEQWNSARPCSEMLVDNGFPASKIIPKKTGTLWLFNIALDNYPFVDGLPMKNGDFPWLR